MNLIGQQLDGEIVRWQDDKGFGFIRSSKLSKDVFFHIRAYRASGKRPQVGERVVFVLEQNREGKLQAVQVQEWQFVRQKQVRQRRRQEQQAAFESGRTAKLLMVAAVYAALAMLVFMGKLPIEVWLWYAGLEALTFLFYWKDKRAAQQGGWRTPEKTLHLLSLLGGWPAAWLAQVYLRHKSQKAEFRLVYFGTVIANLVLLVYVAKNGWSDFLRYL